MFNVLDSDIVESEFEIQPSNYVNFRTNIFGKNDMPLNKEQRMIIWRVLASGYIFLNIINDIHLCRFALVILDDLPFYKVQSGIILLIYWQFLNRCVYPKMNACRSHYKNCWCYLFNFYVKSKLTDIHRSLHIHIQIRTEFRLALPSDAV